MLPSEYHGPTGTSGTEQLSGAPAGIYIHVPFCVRKCPYCDFYSTQDLSCRAAYVAAVCRELEMRKDRNTVFDTLYFGGGTPSTLDIRALESVIDTVQRSFSAAPDGEITLEANPGTVRRGYLENLRQLGVNRINLGIQSLQAANLKFLGRIHTAEEGIESMRAARAAGFENMGLDLMFGLPGQTPENWKTDLVQAVDFAPQHISCYMLTYAPGTEMDIKRRQGRLVSLEDDPLADLFSLTVEFLEEAGYDQYEISNFAKAHRSRVGGLQSRHNIKYWTFAPYLGFGPAAHSYRDPVRSWNVSNVGEYIRRIDAGRLPQSGKETLAKRQKMIEWIYVGLRMNRGVLFNDFERRFSTDFQKIAGGQIDALADEGLLFSTGEGCVLTRRGMLLHDRIVELLVEALPPE